MPDEGAARGPPAAGLLPRQRLGHPYVQQHQVQFAPLPSGASGQPPAHPRPATAIVDEQRLAGAYRHTQPPEVLPPRPRAVHRIRQPGRHHRLAGEMHGARVGNGRGLGPTSQQGALAAPRQSGDHHHRPRWIRQQGRTSPGPRRSTSPRGRSVNPRADQRTSPLHPARPNYPLRVLWPHWFSPTFCDERSSHTAQGLQSRDALYRLLPARRGDAADRVRRLVCCRPEGLLSVPARWTAGAGARAERRTRTRPRRPVVRRRPLRARPP